MEDPETKLATLAHQGALMSDQAPQRLYPVHIDGKSGFIDAHGSVVVAARFDMAGPFHDGLAPVGDFDPVGTPAVPGIVKRRVGFINTSGDMVTPLCFDHARDFSEGRAAVMVGKKWGFIERNGVVVIEPQYDAAWSFTEGIAPVKKGRLYRLIDAAKTYRFNPFDLTKVWPHSDHPLIEVGRMTLDRNPTDYHTEIEQAAFEPNNLVPGIGPSPDKIVAGPAFFLCRRAPRSNGRELQADTGQSTQGASA